MCGAEVEAVDGIPCHEGDSRENFAAGEDVGGGFVIFLAAPIVAAVARREIELCGGDKGGKEEDSVASVGVFENANFAGCAPGGEVVAEDEVGGEDRVASF